MKNIKLIIGIIVLLLFYVFFLIYYKPYNIDFISYESSDNSKISSVDVFMVGDIMLDRNVRNIINKKGFDYFFKGVKNIIMDADISIGNLEGTFTTYPSITSDLKNKELQFTFDPSLTLKLADIGFDILGLANNHSYNFGKNGLEMTRRYIGGSGMMYYGDPFNKDEISTIFTKNGISVALIGFHEFYYENFDKIFYEIERLRSKVDVIIVVPHWGIEYQKEPTVKMQEWAHQFIDSGADMVVGGHSHVIGDIEEYKNKKIFYSLGNFAFDQYFSDKTMKGMGLLINIEKKDKIINLNYKQIIIRVDKEGVRVDYGM